MNKLVINLIALCCIIPAVHAGIWEAGFDLGYSELMDENVFEDDYTTSFRVFTKYQLNENFKVSLSLENKNLEGDYFISPFHPFYYTDLRMLSVEIDQTLFFLGLEWFPFNHRISLYGGIGLPVIDASLKNATGSNVSDDYGIKTPFRFGATWYKDIGNKNQWILEASLYYTYLEIDMKDEFIRQVGDYFYFSVFEEEWDLSSITFSLGLTYRFG